MGTRCSGWLRNANALADARALRVTRIEDYCGLRDGAADAVAATSTEVPLVECSTSTAPAPFAAMEPLLVMASTPPAPVRFAAGVGFCAVAEACGAVLELTFGLEAVAWVAVLVALAALVTLPVLIALAVLLAVLVALVAALAVAGFASVAADSVEPAKLAAPAVPVLETLAAVLAAASPVTDPCFAAFAAGCRFGLFSDPPRDPWP